MTSFWLPGAFLLGLAILFIVVPYFRYRPDRKKLADSDIRKRKNIDVFEQGMAELERDLADGVLQSDEFDRLKTELQRSFLRDMEDEEATIRRQSGKSGWLVPLICLVFVCTFSYSLYVIVGSASDLALPVLLDEVAAAETEEAQQAALENLAAFLQSRFERREDDIQNGYMLGTLQLELERYDAAVLTFNRLAAQLEPNRDKATVLGQLAQAMYLAADSEMTPQVREVIGQAQELNANEQAVMSLLAIDAFIRQDFAAALGYWRRQLTQLNTGSREASVLRDRISRLEELLPAEEQARAVAGGPAVSLVIDIDASVRDRVTDDMRLFVYARNPAMPMPLAAQNLALPDFPFEITLDESMAMIENMTLSTAQNIIVGARLTRSGQAIAQPGDIQGLSEPFPLAEQTGPVVLTINEIVQ